MHKMTKKHKIELAIAVIFLVIIGTLTGVLAEKHHSEQKAIEDKKAKIAKLKKDNTPKLVSTKNSDNGDFKSPTMQVGNVYYTNLETKFYGNVAIVKLQVNNNNSNSVTINDTDIAFEDENAKELNQLGHNPFKAVTIKPYKNQTITLMSNDENVQPRYLGIKLQDSGSAIKSLSIDLRNTVEGSSN